MNIIQAREAAMAGKTVIAPDGIKWSGDDFTSGHSVNLKTVFGEWKIKQEPVVFETIVKTSRMDDEHGAVNFHSEALVNFVGKKVRVTVEALP